MGKVTWLPENGEATQVNGFLVSFEVLNGDVPIWGNYVNVTIHGNQIDGLDFRVYQQTSQAKAAIANDDAMEPLDVRAALATAMPKFKEDLKIKGKYEILKAKLCYVNRSEASGSPADLSDDFVPAWHLIVNRNFSGPGSKRQLFEVWIDGTTGEVLSQKPY
jgi:hypothetical protein